MYLSLSWVYSQASFLWKVTSRNHPGGRTSLANFDKKGGILGYCFRYLQDDWPLDIGGSCADWNYFAWFMCFDSCKMDSDGFTPADSMVPFHFHKYISKAYFFSFISSPDFTNIFVVPYPPSPPISIMFSFSVHCPSHWLRHQSCAERCLQASSKPGRSHQRSW